jgi:hypothetical protein
MTTDGDEIGVLNYVASSMAVFLVGSFVLGLFDYCIKNPNFL